jgi:hypothetical protein
MQFLIDLVLGLLGLVWQLALILAIICFPFWLLGVMF